MDREIRSLLVVDSSATYSFYMTMLLKKLEYTVRSTTTAEGALQMLAASLPALVITDISLPKMSGIDMLKQMRQNPALKSIPVIIHSADSDVRIKETCISVGCTAYFRKPADPDALYRAIQAATEAIPRQNIRIDVSLNVEVGNPTVSSVAVRGETVTTLSEGGLFIKTLTPEPVNTIIPLKLFIHNREIRVTAIVLYSLAKTGVQQKESGMGMRFTNIMPQDKEFIHKYIQEQITQNLSLPSR
ncbi:MAG TPA: response regulator [Nitrospirota bacterium]|nr:response regulator [Nitrospirota bacterium]